MTVKPHHIERMVAGDRLNDLVAEHGIGFKREPHPEWAERTHHTRRRFAWRGKLNGRDYWTCAEDWEPSSARWDNGTVCWTQALEVVARLHALGWRMDLEDHTRDTSIKRKNRSWWYELCRYEWIDDPHHRKAKVPVHHWQLDGGHADPLVAICHAALKAVLCGGREPSRPKRA